MTLYANRDTTFTAHFKRVTPYNVTYKTDGNGTVSPESEVVELGKTPDGCTITPNNGYEFDYWTADVDVELPVTDENVNESATTTIAAGDPITDEQLKQLTSFYDDPTFTAHFKQAAVDPDNPDTIKPTDGTNGMLTPKTGDTLPASTAAVALGAGVVVAGAALLRKRHQ